MTLTPNIKSKIDAMTKRDIAEFYKDSGPGHPWLMSDEISRYLSEKFREPDKK